MIQNLDYPDGKLDVDIMCALETFFTTDKVSIGSIARKLPYILVKLCSINKYQKGTWELETILNTGNSSISGMTLGTFNNVYKFAFDHKINNNLANMRMLSTIFQKMFKNDKWYPYPHNKLTADLTSNDTVYHYIKSHDVELNTCQENLPRHFKNLTLFKASCRRQSFSVTSFMKNIFKSKHPEIKCTIREVVNA